MKKSWSHTLNLSAVFTLLSFFAAAQNGIVNGTVKGGENVLQAATVSLGNRTILTDSSGEFYFSIKPGNYTLIITHTGYKKIAQPVNVFAANTQTFA
ncbi:MAG: carboxypeptidase-like regulatory domain-containing protein, partial [Bacteroidota bacterium]|nr:carboxypeptidase-like regulatory domain-containing protein [Bacteroidota bacterium]